MDNRERFGSRLGFILVSAGCAVGLGNVWKFPYMAGRYGGAAFILIYFLFLIMMGMPIMLCEFSVGRASQKSIATSYEVLEPEGSKWHNLKWLGVIGNYLLVMFYSMVGGWMVSYCYKMLKGDFVNVSAEAVKNTFDEMLLSVPEMIFWTFFVIIISFTICGIGMQKGVEKVSKFMMICLFLLMMILVVRSVTLEGAEEGVKFFLIPDFGKMMENGIGNVVFGAMSQSFFTLSVGMGGMAIFGSYLDRSRSLTGESIHIVILDTLVALMAGLIVIPACFAFGVEPGAGPGLVFITLPNIFTQMAGGRIWGALFFLFLSFAAFTTVIGVFENIVSFAVDMAGWSRKKAVIVNGIALSVLSLPCILGFNVWSSFQPLGAGTNIMDLEDFLVSNNLLPLGALVYLLFCTRKNGWGWENFMAEANAGNGRKFPEKMKFIMSFIVPWLLVIVYLKGYYDMFHERGTTIFVIWMSIAFLFLLAIGSVVFHKNKKGRVNE